MFIITIGGLIIHMMNMNLRTRINSITLLSDGKTIRIKTLNMYGRGILTFPVDKLKSSENCLRDLSPEFLRAVHEMSSSTASEPQSAEKLVKSMQKSDQSHLMDSGIFTGSIKMVVDGLDYKLDIDKSGVFHEPELFNILFNKR
jgi:hypothetical protein